MAVVRDLSGNGTHAPDRSVTKRDQISSSRSVTPSDTLDLDPYASSILVGVTGDVHLTYVNGAEDTLALAAGMWHPMRSIRKVWSTGTTATGIRVA